MPLVAVPCEKSTIAVPIAACTPSMARGLRRSMMVASAKAEPGVGGHGGVCVGGVVCWWAGAEWVCEHVVRAYRAVCV